MHGTLPDPAQAVGPVRGIPEPERGAAALQRGEPGDPINAKLNWLIGLLSALGTAGLATILKLAAGI